MRIITPEFVDHIIASGSLTEARRRAQDASTCPWSMAHQDKLSSWSLICEEILDTEHAPDRYDYIFAELCRRGFSAEQIDTMRQFAWETVGWLNYDRMLWEWVHLDEKDIRMALDWQLREGLITRAKWVDGLAFIENPRRAQPVVAEVSKGKAE